jgi:hypothetical protein
MAPATGQVEADNITIAYESFGSPEKEIFITTSESIKKGK